MPAVAAVDVQQAISQAPPVHGYVPKSGPTKLQYWTSANRTARHQQFEEWIHDIYVNPGSDRATTIKDGMRMRNLPPMYPNCQVLVVCALCSLLCQLAASLGLGESQSLS